MRGRSEQEYERLTDDELLWIASPLERAFGIDCPFPSTDAAQRAAEANVEQLYENLEMFGGSRKEDLGDGRVRLHPPVLPSSVWRPELAPVRPKREGDLP